MKGDGRMDQTYMQHALMLAQKGVGYVNPNPYVGAVIVKDGKIIGEGWHQKYGEPHAEVNALKSCKEDMTGATLYVTLEPCCHYGKTPPCTKAIMKSGIKKVVVGALDANPLVAGKGVEQLRKKGIEVVTSVLEDECKKLNEVFFHFIEHKTPFVIMKYAMTLDGKIATSSGEARWITGEMARAKVHQDRNRLMGIMVGIGTVLADDPRLTCRLQEGRQPIRIICDTYLQIPLTSKIVETAKEIPTIIATCKKDELKHQDLLTKGCEILVVPSKEGHVDLKILMKLLGERGIDSILLEGGGTLNDAMLKERLVHQIQTYIAPKVFGGAKAKSPVEGNGITSIDACYRLKNMTTTCLGEDWLLEGEVDYPCLQE